MTEAARSDMGRRAEYSIAQVDYTRSPDPGRLATTSVFLGKLSLRRP
jgi:hypothetical protein